MKAYIDNEFDYCHESETEPKTKQYKDYAGIGAIIFTFTVMGIVIALSIYTAWQIAYGFVDGNNNGRDDVQEWKNSPDYWIGMSSKEDDKFNRQTQCDIFNGIWNNTGDGLCKYTQGNNTCILSGGILSANENPKCVPAG